MPSDGLPKNLEPLAAGDPATIGPYVLSGRLGSGGMGTVYLGRTPEKGSQVAIKVIRPELAFDEATRARFRDEMENARRVASFCTAKVLDHGTFENRPYMVTEYIAGTPLAEQIAEHGALDSSTLHGFALGVAAALAAIHRTGLVHRDLKPANVLLSLSGPRVIDFGIARAMNTMTNHTKTGIVMGSPGWMAPEQLLEEKVTTSADIFAWGCLVAFAGNGVHPFGNGDAMTLGKRVLFAEPQLGNLDSPLDRLVAKALAKEPERRPKAQDLLLELAGGEGDSGNANDMVSHALHQSWRPNLPPLPPNAAPQGPQAHPVSHPPQGPHQGMPPPGPPLGAPGHGHPQPPHPGQQVPMPAAQQAYPGQQMQHPGPAHQPPAHQTGQFPVASPRQTGPIPQVGPPPQEGPGQTGARPQAQPYVPPAPPPPHRPLQPGKKRVKWIILAALVAALLVLLFTVLTLLVFNRADTTGGTPRDAERQEEDGGSGDGSAAQPGGAQTDGTTDGRMVFNVNEYACGTNVNNRSTTTGGMYCAFDLRVENTSEHTIELDHEWQRLRMASGEFTLALEPSTEERDDSLWREIPAGEKATGQLVFMVPDGAELQELLLGSRDSGKGVEIDLSDVPRRD
ncbi:serine/threonine protein kinase [Allosalinactinospora lopnorensis]|uniref:serine/threonine protein kinase n=1 Tax=Allosalinactinospora lopnorensis TaxID=1352348 RepID=UPI000623D564|nr:serine/threonine-protein kinase [Allosalinactinospora lopnorensis]